MTKNLVARSSEKETTTTTVKFLLPGYSNINKTVV